MNIFKPFSSNFYLSLLIASTLLIVIGGSLNATNHLTLIENNFLNYFARGLSIMGVILASTGLLHFVFTVFFKTKK
jgi:hypothetical protein